MPGFLTDEISHDEMIDYFLRAQSLLIDCKVTRIQCAQLLKNSPAEKESDNGFDLTPILEILNEGMLEFANKEERAMAIVMRAALALKILENEPWARDIEVAIRSHTASHLSIETCKSNNLHDLCFYLSQIIPCTRINSLSIKMMGIGATSLKILTQMPMLTHLELTNCGIEDLSFFADNTSIQSLKLAGNYLEHGFDIFIEKNKSVKHLELTFNRVSIENILKLSRTNSIESFEFKDIGTEIEPGILTALSSIIKNPSVRHVVIDNLPHQAFPEEMIENYYQSMTNSSLTTLTLGCRPDQYNHPKQFQFLSNMLRNTLIPSISLNSLDLRFLGADDINILCTGIKKSNLTYLGLPHTALLGEDISIETSKQVLDALSNIPMLNLNPYAYDEYREMYQTITADKNQLLGEFVTKSKLSSLKFKGMQAVLMHQHLDEQQSSPFLSALLESCIDYLDLSLNDLHLLDSHQQLVLFSFIESLKANTLKLFPLSLADPYGSYTFDGKIDFLNRLYPALLNNTYITQIDNIPTSYQTDFEKLFERNCSIRTARDAGNDLLQNIRSPHEITNEWIHYIQLLKEVFESYASLAINYCKENHLPPTEEFEKMIKHTLFITNEWLSLAQSEPNPSLATTPSNLVRFSALTAHDKQKDKTQEDSLINKPSAKKS